MRHNINNIDINIIYSKEELEFGKIPLIFLHGFTGSAEEWLPFFNHLHENFTPIAIDLPGHGKSDSPNDKFLYSLESKVDLLNDLFQQLNIDSALLCGYSMGGRLALGYALSLKRKIDVKGLILESASPGIKNENERTIRRKEDDNIADKIIKEGIDNFVRFWMSKPIFNSLKKLPPRKYSELLDKKRGNDPIGLANSLRAFGSGVMPFLGDKLNGIVYPTLLIYGERDKKFKRINSWMHKEIKKSQLIEIKNVGHNIHIEKPSEFLNFVNRFLSELIF